MCSQPPDIPVCSTAHTIPEIPARRNHSGYKCEPDLGITSKWRNLTQLQAASPSHSPSTRLYLIHHRASLYTQPIHIKLSSKTHKWLRSLLESSNIINIQFSYQIHYSLHQQKAEHKMQIRPRFLKTFSTMFRLIFCFIYIYFNPVQKLKLTGFWEAAPLPLQVFKHPHFCTLSDQMIKLSETTRKAHEMASKASPYSPKSVGIPPAASSRQVQ